MITPAFASWVLLLFFAIEPTNDMTRKLIYFLFGLLLGVFTSSMSYYGIDYFLIKLPEKSCSSYDECKILDIESQRTDSTITSEEEELGISSGTSTKIAIPNVLLKNTRVFLIFSIIVVLVLFIYMYLTQKK